MRRRVTGFILAGLLMAGAGVAQQKRQDVELQAAIRKENVDGDLNGAIKQYAAMVAKYSKSDRAVAAMAIVHMAECHQKLGDAESRKLYEQVLRAYADQKEAVALARARMAVTSQPGRPTNTLVWKGNKVDSEGTVSPDGRYISFVDWEFGNLALHEIATGQDRIIAEAKNPKTGRWKVFAEESAISKDGKQVAFSWYVESNDRYELQIANLTGDPNPHRLYDDPKVGWLAPWDWSPDGKWIAVLIALKDRTDRLGLVSVADGSLRVLRTGTWPGIRIFFSPDGKYIGYDLPQSDNSQQRDVWVSAVDGSGEIPAVVHRSHDYMMGWSPDGKRLLFGSDRTGSFALWSQPFADGKPHGTPELIKADLGFAEPMGMTRSGALYYGPGRGNVGGSIQVGSFDLASGKVSSPHDVSQNYLEDNVNPCWSSDGKYLAYRSQRGRPGSGQVFVIRSVETGQVVRELQPKMGGSLLGWAPDSRSLLAQGQDVQGRRGAFRIDAQSGDVSLLVENTPQSSVQDPLWSPDGKSLIFWRSVSSDMQVIVQRDLATGAEKEIIRRPYLRFSTILSPDEKYLAVSSVDPSSNSRVMLLAPVGGGEARAVMKVASEVAPEDLRNFNRGQTVIEAFWASDSRSFFARKRRASGDDELWQIPVDGSTPRKLDSSLSRNIFRFTVSPDGSKVAYRQEEPGPRPTPEVWVLENFLPATGGGK